MSELAIGRLMHRSMTGSTLLGFSPPFTTSIGCLGFSEHSYLRNESLCNRPETCSIIRIHSIRSDASAKVRRALADGTCLVTILEKTPAYAGEERRYRHEHRCRRTLLNGLPSLRRSLQAACMLLKVCCDSARIDGIYKNAVIHPAARSLHRE